MKNLFVYLSAIILITSCSSGDGDAPEPINTIESQIVGKTFWRVLEGPTNNPPIYIPHYFGLEFNQDGYIYTRYCSDTLLTSYEASIDDTLGISIDNTVLCSYEIQDSIISLSPPTDWNEGDEVDDVDWSTVTASTYLNMLSGTEYLAFDYFLNRLGVDPNSTFFTELFFLTKVENIDDNNLTLFHNHWIYFGNDTNHSLVEEYGEYIGWLTNWNSESPNCNDYPIYQ